MHINLTQFLLKDIRASVYLVHEKSFGHIHEGVDLNEND